MTFDAYIKDTVFSKKVVITQIRLSTHKFPIESGRYKNIPREQRICNLCCNNLVGDEFHYLFICNEFLLRQRRQTFINEENDILKVNTNFIKYDKKNLFNDRILSLNDCSIFDLLFYSSRTLWRTTFLQSQNYKISIYYNKSFRIVFS